MNDGKLTKIPSWVAWVETSFISSDCGHKKTLFDLRVGREDGQLGQGVEQAAADDDDEVIDGHNLQQVVEHLVEALAHL